MRSSTGFQPPSFTRSVVLATAGLLLAVLPLLQERAGPGAPDTTRRESGVAPQSAPAETVLFRTGAETVSRVWLETPAGVRTRATLRVPNDAGARSIPAFVLVGGFESGWRAAEVVAPGREVALLSVDYPFAGPRRGIPPGEFLGKVPEFWRATRSMEPLLGAAWEYLAARSEVDSTRVLVVGGSLGVPFSLRVASSDPRFRGVAVLYGAAGLGEWVALNIKGVPGWAKPLIGRLVDLLYHDYEPERLIRGVSPRPVLLINSRGDARIPERGARRLYEAARPPREQVWLEGGHMRLSDGELIQRLLGITLEWAERHRLVLPP